MAKATRALLSLFLALFVFASCSNGSSDGEAAVVHELSELYGVEYAGNMSSAVTMTLKLLDANTLHFTVKNSSKTEPTMDDDWHYIWAKNAVNVYTTYWYETEADAAADTSETHSSAKQYMTLGIDSLETITVKSQMGTSSIKKKN